jgi:hypothetical protein
MTEGNEKLRHSSYIQVPPHNVNVLTRVATLALLPLKIVKKEEPEVHGF